MGSLRAMDERRPDSNRVVAALIVLIILFTAGALYAPRFERHIIALKAAPAAHPVLPVVQVWLSTADRRLKLAQQVDVDMAPRGTLPVDVDIDLRTKYQTMVGFGAAMTDSSAWLLQNKLSALQRDALLHELYGPPPNLNLTMMRLTIGASD